MNLANLNHSKCAIHDRDETIYPETFRICGECSHVYPSPMSLISADLQTQIIGWTEFAVPMKPQTRNIDEIHYCPLCLHDW